MLNRKLWVGVASICLGSIALANGGAPAPISTEVPLKGGIFVSAEALYFQPNSYKLSMGGIVDESDSIDGIPAKIIRVKPSHDLGFRIKAGYCCPNKDTDITIGYTRLHTKDKRSISLEEGIGIMPVLPFTILGSIFFHEAQAQTSFAYDAFDLMLGQKKDIKKLNWRLAAGLRYAKIDSDHNVYYDEVCTSPGGPYAFRVDRASNYHGMGPRAELDGIYHLGFGINITASAGTTLLVGRGHFNDHLTSFYHQEEDYTEETGIKSEKVNRVVPELDARLGLSYTYSAQRYNFSIGAGWEAINYFEVRDSLTDGEKADISFNGPYAGIHILVS